MPKPRPLGPAERPVCDPCREVYFRHLDAGTRPYLPLTPPMVQIGAAPTAASVVREAASRRASALDRWRAALDSIEQACQRGPHRVGCERRPC